jgi:hypothetical protein
MTGTRRFMHEDQDRCVHQIGADATLVSIQSRILACVISRLALPAQKNPPLYQGKKYPRYPRNSRFERFKKTFKKVQKKACQAPARSAKRGFNATSGSRRPFKKTLKKVKKKLVSVWKI